MKDNMKGYTKPQELGKGKCFICGKPCDENVYCHDYCAIAYSEEKMRKVNEAMRNTNDTK